MKHQVDFLELLQIDYEKYPVIAVPRPPIWQESLNFRLPGAEMQSG